MSDTTKPKTIDCTPSWSSLVPILIELASHKNLETRTTAREELTRMGKLADAYVELKKNEKKD